MKRTILNNNLTKEYIESKVSQELIVSKYLDIPIEIVEHCIKNNALIKSVFRDDDYNKSMGIQYNIKGRLKVRDFGGFGFFGDCYDIVAYVLSIVYERKIEPNNRQDFYFILKHIAYTFSDIIDGKESDPNVQLSIQDAITKGKTKRAIIEIVPRSWNHHDKEVWGQWNINLNYLNTHFVIPVDQYYINRGVDTVPKYYYSKKDPCYAYTIGQDKHGIYLFKLYFPLRDRKRQQKFITNSNVLEGLLNLELDNYDYIVITKSSKDRLSIGSHLFAYPLYGGASNEKLNIGIVNLPSESYNLKQNEYDYLFGKLKTTGMIISLMDFDRTGRKCAKYLEEVYNIPYIFITRGEFGLPNIGCKDFAELHDKYTKDEINVFIKDTLKYIELKFTRSNETSYFDDSLTTSSNVPF